MWGVRKWVTWNANNVLRQEDKTGGFWYQPVVHGAFAFNAEEENSVRAAHTDVLFGKVQCMYGTSAPLSAYLSIYGLKSASGLLAHTR